MGSGKTAVGRAVARELGLQFVDSDTEIRVRTGVDIPFIFEKEGEAGFRAREKDVIESLSQRREIVVATGGGSVLDPENRCYLVETGVVIYLDTSIDEQLKRTGRSRQRPLLMTDEPRAVLMRLREIREPLYREIADIYIDTTGKRVKRVATTVCDELRRFREAALQN